MLKITIIGAGHGGQALAADLTQRGCEVTLCAHPNHLGGIRAVEKARGIYCSGLINGFVKLAKVTTDFKEAVSGSDFIYIVVPSQAHEIVFIEMLPYLQKGQTIITLAANFSSLVYLKLLQRTNKEGIGLIDIASLPYVCRSDNQGSVDIISVKKLLAAASIPANQIKHYIQTLQPTFPCELIAYQDVLSLSMNITSGMTHPAVTLLNAGRIASDKDIFYFYRDGITPEIAEVIGRIDEERLQIGKYLGLEMYPYLDLMEQYYGIRHRSIYQFFRDSKPHNVLPLCPRSLKERYITQDVAGVLVPWYSLGTLTNGHLLVLKNLITLASLLNNNDYLRTGTNLVQMNLHDKTIPELKHYVRFAQSPSGMYGRCDELCLHSKQDPVIHNVA